MSPLHLDGLLDFYKPFQKIAFKMDAERVHELSVAFLAKYPKLFSLPFQQEGIDSRYGLKVGPLTWSFPVGLAAGLDKNAAAIDFFSRLLFGAIEVGTVTPKAQTGNPKPRLFRLKSDKSLLNRMGFNNEGAEALIANILRANRHAKCLGVNIGKNKTTPQEKAIEDYRYLYQKFSPYVDYLVINISSPNTPGLRDLQSVSFLKGLMHALADDRREVPCPLFIKLSPDIPLAELSSLLDVMKMFELTGVIATNTTQMPNIGQGGVSGKLLSDRGREFRREILRELKGSSLECIGVGGMSSYEDLVDFWRAGGKAIQVYTAFIYQGPQLLDEIRRGIDRDLREKNFDQLEELINFYQSETEQRE